MPQDTLRILARDRLISNNTRATRINNNDLIIGPIGAGKTRNYVKPNLFQYALEGGFSLIVADTKGSLVEEVGPVMAAHGYRIINLDFIHLMNNAAGYNPLDFVSYDPPSRAVPSRRSPPSPPPWSPSSRSRTPSGSRAPRSSSPPSSAT